ncbi:peptidoglycan endopeptidase [Clostridiaceae bacterium]|nr:peptidoglycan endopeptidase [Clostridiaceae bacterium]RKI09293.1 peptidoglycan endopeptidase [bacterium 1XD21-70]
MRKAGLYLTAMMMTAGVMMWRTPILSYAEPIVVEANEITEEEIEDTTDNGGADNSPVMEASSEAGDLADSGPDLEVQARARAQAQAEAEAQAARDAAAQAAESRKNVVNYALQFVGGPYRAGGNDPRTGVDCSGFVKYVMQNGAGIGMNRSSVTQATQGKAISANQMQPGDLIFYGNGSRINHVAMYIGNGQIVHASTYSTGIKISNWNYRAPVKIISMFG